MSDSNGNNSVQLDSRNAAYVEGLLEEYLEDSTSVPPVWQQYFRELTDGNGEILAAPRRPKFKPTSVFNPSGQGLPQRESDQTAGCAWDDRRIHCSASGSRSPHRPGKETLAQWP